MSVSVISSQEKDTVTQGLNQRNNTQRMGPTEVTMSQMTLHPESHSKLHLWIKCVFEPFPQAHGRTLPLLFFYLPSTVLTFIGKTMIYHTNSPRVYWLLWFLDWHFPWFHSHSFFLLALTWWACISKMYFFFVKKKHWMPGALCAGILFTWHWPDLKAG